MSAPPVPCMFKNGVFHPLGRARNVVAAHYTENEVVLLAPVEETSPASMAHEFAWLKDAWLSLPEVLAETFPTPEHLRKRALIMGGFFNETAVDAGTNAAALRVAAFMRGQDEFAWVVVRGPLAVMRTAKSQSKRTMKKDEFQASKTALMEVVAGMLGVEPNQLPKQAAA